MIKLSVVIPLHNAEEYMDRCIDSVIKQEYEDMEIILVDDGSTDATAEICKQYCKKDSRFRYIHQEDSWLSASRNNGMRNSAGKYIVFLDPDDYWESDFCENVIPIMEQYELEVLQFNFFFEFSSNNKKVISFCEETHVEEWSKDNLLKNICTKWLGLKYPNTVWGKVFNRAFLLNTGIKFEESLRGYEDVCFWGMLFPYISKIGYINKPLYHYVQHPKSAVHSSSHHTNLFREGIRAYDYIINSWTDEIWQQVSAIKPLIFCRRLQTAFLQVKYSYSVEEACEMLDKSYRSKINKELDYTKINHAVNIYAEICEIPWRDKMLMLLFAYSLIDGIEAMKEWQKMYSSLTV